MNVDDWQVTVEGRAIKVTIYRDTVVVMATHPTHIQGPQHLVIDKEQARVLLNILTRRDQDGDLVTD